MSCWISQSIGVHGQVCDDIYRIWDWVLTEKCYIGAKMRPRLSAVLVVPDTLDNRGENFPVSQFQIWERVSYGLFEENVEGVRFEIYRNNPSLSG